MNQDPSPELLDAVKRGEPEAVRRWVESSEKVVYPVIMNLVGNPTDAEDVLQETLINAYRGLPGFRGEASHTTWLRTVAVNTSYNYLKHNMLRKYITLDIPTLDIEVGSKREQEDIQTQVRKAIDELPPALKTVVVLYDIERLTHKEIADILGCPEGTVWSYLSRARARLRDKLKKYFGQP